MLISHSFNLLLIHSLINIKARADVQSALVHDPGNNELKTVLASIEQGAASKLRELGNNEMKNNNYASAITYYSDSLRHDDSYDNLASYCNRALAYLKVHTLINESNTSTLILQIL